MRADPLSMGPPAAASGDAGSHPGVPRPHPPRGAAAAPRDGAHAPCRTTPDALSPPSPSIPSQGSFQALLRFPPLPFSFFGSSGNSGEELPTAENAESAEARRPTVHGPAEGGFRRRRKSSRGATAAPPKRRGSGAPRWSSCAVQHGPKCFIPLLPVHPRLRRFSDPSTQTVLRSPQLLGFPPRSFLPFFSATPCLFSSAFSAVRLLSLKSRKIEKIATDFTDSTDREKCLSRGCTGIAGIGAGPAWAHPGVPSGGWVGTHLCNLRNLWFRF